MDHDLSGRERFYCILCLAALGISLAVLFLMLFLQTYSCDDYVYLSFLDNGMTGFLENMRWHYASMNGRLLIHSVVCIVLRFGHPAVAFTGLAILWGCFFLGIRLCRRRTGGLPLTGAVLFFAGLLLLPFKVMQQGILWTSAFYNYVFPLLPLLVLLLLLRKQQSAGTLRFGGVLLVAAAAFFSGGSTELYGILTCSLLGWELLWALIRREKRIWVILLAIAAAAGGLALIFLSPATAVRVGKEVRLDLKTLLERLADQGSLFRRCSGMFLQLAGLQAALAFFGRRKRMPLLIAGGTVGALLSGLLYLLPERWAGSIIYPAILAVLLAEALLLAPRGEDGLAELLLGAPLTLLIMLATSSTVNRTLAAFSLFELLALADCTEDCRPHPLVKTFAVCLLTAGALAVTLPDLPARLNNYCVDRKNAAAAVTASETGEMTVCMDYDLRYSYRNIFLDDLFPWYMKHYGLTEERTRFLVTGSSKPVVCLNGQRLDLIAFPGDIMAAYPLQKLMNAAGAECEIPEPNQCVIRWKGLRYTVVCDPDSTHYHNTRVSWTDPDGTEHSCAAHRTPSWITEDFYMIEDVFENVWDMQFRHNNDSILIEVRP